MLTYVLATAGFKHDVVKQDHHCKLSLNYDKQFNKGGHSVTMSCKKGVPMSYFLSIFISPACLRNEEAITST